MQYIVGFIVIIWGLPVYLILRPSPKNAKLRACVALGWFVASAPLFFLGGETPDVILPFLGGVALTIYGLVGLWKARPIE